MTKKISSIVFLLFCLLFCCCVGLSSFFSEGDAAAERRELTEFPRLFLQDGTVNENFDSLLSDYLSERMPLRSASLDVKSDVFSSCFGISYEDKVILGKNDWLFFQETADEFTGNRLMTQRGIRNVVDTLEQISDYCRKKQIRFVFCIAPDKNTLYPENMPGWYIPARENNYTAVQSALADSSVNWVDFSGLAQMSPQPLYYRTDTHWTASGACIAYDSLMTALALEHESYAGVSTQTQTVTGDLETMRHPSSPVPETEEAPVIPWSFSYTSRYRSPEDIRITTANPAGNGSLVMFRDSFGNALLPYFAQHFASAVFSRAVPVDLTDEALQGADTVVYEIVQRNLENIVSYAPVIPAEPYTDSFDMFSVEGSYVLKTEEKGELTHFYGEVDADRLQTDSEIYIALASAPDFDRTFYRCLPVYEKGLLEAETCQDNGFSCYIPTEEIQKHSGLVYVFVCVKNGGVMTCIQTDIIL